MYTASTSGSTAIANQNSLWHTQHKAFASILDTVDEKTAWTLKEHVWSCVYYDAFCQTVLATLYKIGDLRRKNATLHLPLHKMDTEVPGTNAIVVMEPTKQNITILGNAVARGVVSTVYLYLVGQIEKGELDGLLDMLAKLTRENAGAIKSIQQKNLAFVSLTSSLYSLGAGSR